MKCIDLPTNDDTPESVRLSIDELSKDTRPGTIEMMNTLERYAQTLERVAELEAQIFAHEHVCAGRWVPVGERLPAEELPVQVRVWDLSEHVLSWDIFDIQHGEWHVNMYDPPTHWIDVNTFTSSGEVV